MSTLTGNQIKNTYQGLLKLDDSSTGITTTLQSVQDGLGNDTGVKIKQNVLTAPNLFGLQKVSIRKVGSGLDNVGTLAYSTDEYDSIHWTPFYDFGLNSYTGLTYQVSAITSTSDVVSIAFYDTQFNDTYGLVPYQLIATGGTLTTNSTGQKTLTLPSPLTFSGYGGGFFFIGLITTNGGVTPTVKFHKARYQQQVSDFLRVFFGGFGTNSQINSYVNAGVQASGGSPINTNTLSFWSGGTSYFEPVFSGSTLTAYAPYPATQPWFGFQLLASR